MSDTAYTVTYNSQQPWQTGVPYVSLDVEEIYSAGQIGTIRTVTLNGTFPNSGVNLITGIQAVFASNFKAFSAPNVYMPCAMVQEVTFGSQNYLGKVDYTIVLKDFSGILYNVTEPIDDITLQTETDGSITINHKISAIGIDTGINASTAFNNARSFVTTRTGISNLLSAGTTFVSSTNSGQVFILSQQETINRTLGSYSITETFKYDPLRGTTNGTFKRFSVEYNSGINNDYVQVSVNGTYTVGKDVWNTGLYAQVASADLYALAYSVANDINPIPLTFSIEAESISQISAGTTGTRLINAQALYDNSQTASFFDYDIETNKDFRNGITQVSVRGIIIGSGKHARRKFDSALSFYNTGVGGWNGARTYLYGLARSGATDFGYTNFAFNPLPKSFSVVFSSGQGLITINASFDDAPFVSGYSSFNWNVTTDCGLNIFKTHPSANVNGSYIVQDLNILNRTNVTLNGDFSFPSTGSFDSSAAASMLISLQNLEGTENAFLEAETYNKSSGNLIVTGFNYSYSKNGRSLTILPTNGKIYAGINL